MVRSQFTRTFLWGLMITVIPGILSCLSKGDYEHAIFDFSLEEITIDELQEKMEKGIYTSVQITEIYLDRIQLIDKNGFELRSVIEINRDAMSIAAELDREREHGRIRGPLHGIPVLIKDNINTADRLQTTSGSLALNNHYAAEDAMIVKQLRKAGAIILGKTNLSEWSNFRSHNSISGWSSRGGQTKNPFILDQLPCGSSSGSAVAVSSNLCVVSVGTSTDGSISCPASLNGIVGIRPTVGLVSTDGIIPISKTLDTPGALARTVKDAAILLEVMIDRDQFAYVAGLKGGGNHDFFKNTLSADGLSGKRIGVEKAMIHNDEDIGKLLKEAIELLKQQGAEIVEVSFQDQYYKLLNYEFELMKYEFKDGINEYLAKSNSDMHTLEDIITYNNRHVSRVMPHFKQELLYASLDKGSLDEAEYRTALSQILTMRNFIEDLMSLQRLDALCGVGNGASGPACMARNPSITLPIGSVNELPVGITFFSKAYHEAVLLNIAYAYEQASQKRTPPKFLKSFPADVKDKRL